MAGKKAKKAADPNKEPRCVWTDVDDAVLVRELKLQKDAGNQSGAGWKKQVWTVVEAAIAKDGIGKGGVKTAAKCSDHWANLKKQFLEVHSVRGNSGFGWDDVTQKVIASDDVWAKYLASHPTHERWRTTPFPTYHDMHYLVNGVVATGEDVFHPGQSPGPSAATGGSDEDEARSTVSDSVIDPVLLQQQLEPTTPAVRSRSATNVLNDPVADEIMDNEDPITMRTGERKSSESHISPVNIDVRTGVLGEAAATLIMAAAAVIARIVPCSALFCRDCFVESCELLLRSKLALSRAMIDS